MDEISELKKSYVFRDRGIDKFLESHPALVSVLMQAVTPLKEAFGADGVFRLELETEEEGSRMIYAAALSSGSVREAARALDQFVDGWWLDHMTNQTSDLAFVYRIWRWPIVNTDA